MVWNTWLFLAWCCLQPAHAQEPEPAGADVSPRERRGETWDAWGEARLAIDGASPYGVDDLGTTQDRMFWARSRLVAGVEARPRDWLELAVELEAANGWFAGQASTLGTVALERPFRMSRSGTEDLARVIPRRASVGFTAPGVGKFVVGAQTFGWGLGMLSNDGRTDSVFGDSWQGNTVLRVGWFGAPWRSREGVSAAAKGTVIFAAADVALRDDNALLYEGDLAVSGILGARVRTERSEWGLLAVARWQRDQLDETHPLGRPETLVFPLDLYGTHRVWSADGRALTISAEGALVVGSTERPFQEASVDGAGFLAGGLLGRVQFDDDRARTTARLEAGWASGDPDPRDGVARGFTMHSDHNVGLVLFDEVLPMWSARTADRVADPELSAVQAPGLRHTVQQGGVTNAVYLHPTVQVRPVAPLELSLGMVAAWSAAPLVDNYQSALQGGYNATPSGGDGSARYLGTEVDGGIDARVSLPGMTALRLGGEAGLLLPGGALVMMRGNGFALPVRLRARLALEW